MDQADHSETSGGEPPHGADLRAAPRYNLLLRTAKYVCDGDEFFCIVRDVSADGVRLKFFHPLPLGQDVALELSNGRVYPLVPVWEEDNHAGFQFADPIDVQDFMDETSQWPKRKVRLRVSTPAIVTADGVATGCLLRDISQQGIGIRVERYLALAQKIRVEVPGMPSLTGTICWRSTPDYGLVLDNHFALDELARMVPGLHRIRVEELDPRLAGTG